MINIIKSIGKKIADNWNVILLFLFSLHFFGKEELILLGWGIVGIFFGIREKRKISIDFHGIVMIAIFVIYAVVYRYYFSELKSYTKEQMFQMIVLPILMYYLCRQMVFGKNDAHIEKVLWMIAGGTFIYTLLNYLVYLQNGFLEGRRIWPDFWLKEPLYATQHSYWGVFISALIGYAFCCIFEKKWLRGLAALLGSFVSNYVNLVVHNRMVLMTTVVTVIMCVMIFFVLNWYDFKKIAISVLAFSVITIIVVVIVKVNWTKIVASNGYAELMGFMSRDGGILHNVRFDMIIDTLRQLPQYPCGGGYIYPAGYAGVHNYWLQAANDTGIVTLVLWCIYGCLMVIETLWVLFQRQIDRKIKYMLIPMIGASGAYLMMEIGGGGMSDYIIFFIMLSAILHQLFKDTMQKCKKGKENAGNYHRDIKPL